MKRTHLTLISDSTGETVSLSVQAAISQFTEINIEKTVHSFASKPKDLHALPKRSWEETDLVIYTLVRSDTREALLEICRDHKLPAIALLDPLLTKLSILLGKDPTSLPGSQYNVTHASLGRFAALDYAMTHDDGKNADRLLAADVVLTGVSRTSKTPTCIYLAYQGIKAANVPLVYRQEPPQDFLRVLESGHPVVGLTISANRLAQIRSQRLLSLGQSQPEDYADQERVEEEIVAARLLFDRYNLPVIDVTRRSIEETAATIRSLLR